MRRSASRPRSPMSATTTASASLPRAIVSSSVDLPAPGAPKTPIRAPRPNPSGPSMARIPVANSSRHGRRSATPTMGNSRTKRCARIGGLPSRAAPCASTARPSSTVPRPHDGGSTTTVSPWPMPSRALHGASVQRVPLSATTRAVTVLPPRTLTISPARANGSSASSSPPRVAMTVPQPRPITRKRRARARAVRLSVRRPYRRRLRGRHPRGATRRR